MEPAAEPVTDHLPVKAIWCPLCSTRSATVQSAAGDEAVLVRCGKCTVIFMLPITPAVVARVAELYGRPDLIPAEAAPDLAPAEMTEASQ